MAKVFRLQQNGTNVIEHWGNSSAYGKKAIQDIVDGNGDAASKQITSIPSPFARFNLLDTAFKYVNTHGIEGDTIYHKMVSDCLDIGEIFFNIDKYKNDIEIIAWDAKTDLEKLIQSNNSKHKQLGNTLDLFLKQDAASNNFNSLHRIYLLNYKKGSKVMNIIGGTSPTSIFSTTANDYANKVDIVFGNHKVFSAILPLYKRDFEFQKFLYAFINSDPQSKSKFNSIGEYLYTNNYPYLTQDQKNIISTINPGYLENNYSKISVDGGNNYVEALNFYLYKNVQDSGKILNRSEFVINPNISQESEESEESEELPLVLPVDTFTDRLLYTTAKWDHNNHAPYFDSKTLQQRVLPFDGTQYPYLTISDFLEDYIIKTPYPINKERFFNGNFTANNPNTENGYLLPLKSTFFKYFTPQFLQGKIAGQNIIEIREYDSPEYVSVTLRIPIKNNHYITYQRNYFTGGDFNNKEADISQNKGAILSYSFGLALTPFFESDHLQTNHYRVGLFDGDANNSYNENQQFTLAFNKNNKEITPRAIKQRRANKAIESITSTYYVLEDSFNHIQFHTDRGNGVLIPKWLKKIHGTVQFNFAVDFGTTNTHIEYNTSLSNNPVPFEISKEEVALVKLHNIHDPNTALAFRKNPRNLIYDNIILFELLPELLGEYETHSFPQRTVLSHNINTNLTENNFILADFNIPFYFQKRIVSAHIDRVVTNLKWTDFNNDLVSKKLVEAYLENLAFIMRNKVLIHNGDLDQTKINWLFPSSMDHFRKSQLGSTWEKIYKKYFGNNVVANIQPVSESIAPFNYYKTQGVNAMDRSVVSIDIGGGTTDVVVYANNKPQLLTSFKFAANDLFGDAIDKNADYNGFIRKYEPIFSELLSKEDPLNTVSQNLLSKKNTADYITFLFSLDDNKDIDTSTSFSDLLQNDLDLKIATLLFFNAIIYHIANMMKTAEVVAPKYFTFSGTGSKVLNILDNSTSKNILTKLINAIFSDIYKNQDVDIAIRIDKKVKEISSKGALLDQDLIQFDIDKIKTVFENNIINPEIKYNEINDDVQLNAFKEYTNFIEWFFNFNNTFSYRNYFGIDASNFNLYKEILQKNAKDYLLLELEAINKIHKGNEETLLEETLFFYPLKGSLNELVYHIATKNTN